MSDRPTDAADATSTRIPARVRIDGWLHVAFGIALAYAVLDDARLVGRGLDGAAGTAVVLTVAAGVAWWARLRRRRRSEVPVVEDGLLAAASLGLSVLAQTNPGALLVLVTALVLALDLGFRVAFGYAVLVAVGYFFSTLALFADDTVATTIGPTFGTLALVVMPAGVGHVLRALERARTTAATAARGLDRANQQLREAFPAERSLVLARERARSARGLHESLTRALRRTGDELSLAASRRELEPAAAWASVWVADEVNKAALAEMRLWVRALDPPSARTLAQPATSDAIAEAFRGTGLDVRVQHHGRAAAIVDDDVALFATRFVQESFTNVLKHSDAGRVDLEIHQEPDVVRLVVVDDGDGCEGDEGAVEGSGLGELRVQADRLGGRVEVVARDQRRGFRVEAVLPVAPAASGPANAVATPPTSHLAVERGLAVVAAVGTLLGLLICWVVLREDGAPEAVLGAALVLGTALAWVRRRATSAGSAARLRVDWVLAACSAVLFLLPHTSEAAILPGILATLVLALEAGVVAALVYVVVLGTADGLLTAFVWTDATGGVQLALLLLLSALAGQLLKVTERARTAAAATELRLADANAELRRSLAREGELVLSEERARSARELHDGLGHRLTLVSMSLQFARLTQQRDPERAWAEVGTAAASVREALAELGRWVQALDRDASSDLDDVAAAFREAGLDVRLQRRGTDQPLSRELALFATRFVQEGLTNVLKHASADRVDVEVVQSPQQVRLTIEDDGVGRPAPAPGFGLRSLQERAALLGGAVTAGTSSAGGFELVAVLPHGGEA